MNKKIPPCKIISFRGGQQNYFQYFTLNSLKEKGCDAIPMVISIEAKKYHVIGNFYMEKHDGEDKLYCQFYFDAKFPPRYSKAVMQQIIDSLSHKACQVRLEEADGVIFFPP